MNYIKKNRAVREMTMKDLADKLGVSHNLIHRWENFKSFPSKEMKEKMEVIFKEKYFYYDGTVGGYVKYVREREKMTGEQISKVIGMTQPSWSNLENNKNALTTDMVLALVKTGLFELEELIDAYKRNFIL